MRLRNLKETDNLLNECTYLIRKPELLKGKWENEFGNSNPINLEIGMGKGDYIYNMALKYPDINFIGVEKYSGVIARAIKKYPNALPNLRIINMDALKLNNVFNKEISTIYLNFSDPWPKKRTEKRRLTSDIFLSIYDNLFIKNKKIVMKTDNIILFASSLVSLSCYGYILKDVNLDLANYDIPNVLTEYESKFMKNGVKINYLVAEKD
ncbi:MAG: tRNA (guanosine(46)-N7)-methyltransferase TrmB [Firmicutes bacterium]|nr:tRNA (guanosine(46)-N7)-methyltransferase TrmB [Bacillota bacterium]